MAVIKGTIKRNVISAWPCLLSRHAVKSTRPSVHKPRLHMAGQVNTCEEGQERKDRVNLNIQCFLCPTMHIQHVFFFKSSNRGVVVFLPLQGRYVSLLSLWISPGAEPTPNVIGHTWFRAYKEGSLSATRKTHFTLPLI